MTSNFSKILLDANPDQIAYIYQDQYYTVKDIQNISWIKVNALIEKGIKPQQKVILIANDSINWITTFWALSIIGCCTIALHPDTDADQIKNICVNNFVDNVITDNNLLDINCSIIFIDKLNTLTNYQITPYNYSAQEPFVCFSTSGTTGNPKLTVHTNYSVLNWGDIIISFYKRISLYKNETMFSLARLSFVVGFMNNIIGPMFTGTKSLIGVRPAEFRKFDQICDKFSVASIMLTPYMLDIILTSKIKSLPESLRTIVSGGEPLSDLIVERFKKKFNRQIVNCYGLSETCFNFSESDRHKSKSIGKPLDTIKTKIINDDGNICGVGEIGTMFITTPGQTIGYLDDPESTSQLLVDGWINTRDLVSIDETGDVIFHGRKNSCIKYKGRWVSLLDIEHTILEINGVKNCVVLQTISKFGLTELKAFISTINNNSIKQTDIQMFLIKKFKKSLLAPENIKFVEDIPTTVNTKKIRDYGVIKNLVTFTNYV
jgi:acyl-coenzyme A synthetase/AMP-(fatty) acid ligase